MNREELRRLALESMKSNQNTKPESCRDMSEIAEKEEGELTDNEEPAVIVEKLVTEPNTEPKTAEMELASEITEPLVEQVRLDEMQVEKAPPKQKETTPTDSPTLSRKSSEPKENDFDFLLKQYTQDRERKERDSKRKESEQRELEEQLRQRRDLKRRKEEQRFQDSRRERPQQREMLYFTNRERRERPWERQRGDDRGQRNAGYLPDRTQEGRFIEDPRFFDVRAPMGYEPLQGNSFDSMAREGQSVRMDTFGSIHSLSKSCSPSPTKTWRPFSRTSC